jgi:hypothetical protein
VGTLRFAHPVRLYKHDEAHGCLLIIGVIPANAGMHSHGQMWLREGQRPALFFHTDPAAWVAALAGPTARFAETALDTRSRSRDKSCPRLANRPALEK